MKQIEENKMKPKGQNELTKRSIKLFKKVLKDIKQQGMSDCCPIELKWDYFSECKICKQAFPKNNYSCSCPCDSGYTKEYLIEHVQEIIKSGKI